MNIAIVGSRNWIDETTVANLVKLLKTPTTQFLTGDCRTGVDNLVRYHAKGQVKIFRADWDAHGKAAGPIRNEELIKEANLAFVLKYPSSRGSANVVEICKRRGVPCFVYEIEEELPTEQTKLKEEVSNHV